MPFYKLYLFRQRKFEENLINLFRALLLPVCSLLGLIFIRAPAFQNITFTSEANFQMSAGFGSKSGIHCSRSIYNYYWFGKNF